MGCGRQSQLEGRRDCRQSQYRRSPPHCFKTPIPLRRHHWSGRVHMSLFRAPQRDPSRPHSSPRVLGADSERRQRATATRREALQSAVPSCAVCHDAVCWRRERVRVKEHVERSASGDRAVWHLGVAANSQGTRAAGFRRREARPGSCGRPSERGAGAVLGRSARGTARSGSTLFTARSVIAAQVK